jgi:excisionase family DNA binding protein
MTEGINVTSVAFGDVGYTVYSVVILAPNAAEVNCKELCHMSNISKAIIDADAREELLRQYLSLPEDQREQKFPTTKRAAQLIGMSRRTIQYWVEIKDIEAIFVGKICRVRLDSLVTYLESRVNGQKQHRTKSNKRSQAQM